MQEQIKLRIENTINNIASLPTISEVASKIINMVNDPDISIKKVAEEISLDQAMTTNILKLCNSAYYSKGKEISSVDRAIVTIGLKEVKDIVMIVATKPILDKPIAGYDLAKGDLWQQGLIVANLSKNIALLKKRKDIADIVFTGGIIHNVGKIVLALYVHSAYKEILDTIENKNITFTEAEHEVMGYSHEEIGERILANWKFPPVLRAIVRYYSEPDKAPKEFKYEVSVVHIASSLCLMAGIGIGSDGLYYQINDNAVKTLGLSNKEIEELYSNIPESMKQVRDLM